MDDDLLPLYDQWALGVDVSKYSLNHDISYLSSTQVEEVEFYSKLAAVVSGDVDAMKGLRKNESITDAAIALTFVTTHSGDFGKTVMAIDKLRDFFTQYLETNSSSLPMALLNSTHPHYHKINVGVNLLYLYSIGILQLIHLYRGVMGGTSDLNVSDANRVIFSFCEMVNNETHWARFVLTNHPKLTSIFQKIKNAMEGGLEDSDPSAFHDASMMCNRIHSTILSLKSLCTMPVIEEHGLSEAYMSFAEMHTTEEITAADKCTAIVWKSVVNIARGAWDEAISEISGEICQSANISDLTEIDSSNGDTVARVLDQFDSWFHASPQLFVGPNGMAIYSIVVLVLSHVVSHSFSSIVALLKFVNQTTAEREYLTRHSSVMKLRQLDADIDAFNKM